MGKTVPILYVDPVAGASGDMFLGALVDLGADFGQLEQMLSTLGVPGFGLEREAVARHTIGATKVNVVVDDEPHPHRTIGELLAIIGRAPLPERVRERAGKVLTRLAQAEAQVHRMPFDHVHLHEVGALDSLVDIVGTCVCLELLGIDRVYSGPVTVGTGFIKCAHGTMPVPAPGTLAVLEGFPIRKTSINHEMTTPTGAAIIAALGVGFVEPLVMTPRRTGYGAADTDPREFTNLLRLVLADVNPRLLPSHHHARPIAPPDAATTPAPDHSHGHDHGDGHHHHH